MKTQEKTIKVYYGLKWEFKPITKEKYHRLKENSLDTVNRDTVQSLIDCYL